MLCLDLPPHALLCVFFLNFYGYILVVLAVVSWHLLCPGPEPWGPLLLHMWPWY